MRSILQEYAKYRKWIVETNSVSHEAVAMLATIAFAFSISVSWISFLVGFGFKVAMIILAFPLPLYVCHLALFAFWQASDERTQPWKGK